MTAPDYFSDARTIREVIGISVGAASMCWEHVDRAGVFNSAQASVIVDQVLDVLAAAGLPGETVLPPTTPTSTEGAAA